jgi:hypothetical protein
VAESTQNTTAVGDDMVVLDNKLKQLKLEYEQYFIGFRPREPVMLRSEVNKLVARYSNTGIQNTALRFRFNNLCARFFAMRRQWDAVLRQIEEGTYRTHLFKAKLHERERREAREPAPSDRAAETEDLFESYLAARRDCGEDVKGLTRERLERLVETQRAAIQERFRCREVRFRVVIENGRTKLKATPVKDTVSGEP